MSAAWAVRDTWTVAGRAIAHWVRRPAAVVAGLLFPVLVVVMFTYLLGGQMAVPGGGEYVDFLVPGVVALTMLFGIETTMLAVTTDTARGVTDRFRALPMTFGAVVLGRGVADLLHGLAALAVVAAGGLLVGWSWRTGAGDVLAAFGLLVLLRFALIWLGVWLGLVAGDPQAVMAVQVLVWPVGFLSSGFVDPSTMPGWVGTLAEWNPLSATVTATRSLFGGPGGEAGTSWAATHATELAVAWPLLITAVFLPLALRRWRRLGD
jgi:ABC-type multidrug transport system permease subunit